jgi:hypothetical protein
VVEKLEQDTPEQAGNSPSADLSLAHDTTPKVYSRKREPSNSDIQPQGGTWTVLVKANDANMYRLEYEKWGDGVDPFTIAGVVL